MQGDKRRCIPPRSEGNVDDVEQESDEEGEADDGDDDNEFEAQSGEEVDERGINKLFQQIRMCQRPDIP